MLGLYFIKIINEIVSVMDQKLRGTQNCHIAILRPPLVLEGFERGGDKLWRKFSEK